MNHQSRHSRPSPQLARSPVRVPWPRFGVALIAAAVLIIHSGCTGNSEVWEPYFDNLYTTPEGEQQLARLIADGANPAPAIAFDDDAPGLHNLFFVAPFVISGSGPDTPQAFDSLAELGVKTIISVDGARPSLELARARGMRYIHIPIGYDGIDARQQTDLAKAIRDSDVPIYIHCHHGKHRGPAAAAVGLVTLGRMNTDHAAAFMHAAGTSDSYPGLWDAMRNARPQTDAEIDAAYTFLCFEFVFPEYQPVSGLVDGMVAIDATWARVKLIRAADWQAPPDHPDLAPAAETGALADHFRALLDDPDTRAKGDEFIATMQRAAEKTSALEASLTRIARDPAFIERAFESVGSSCTECHRRWRD